MFPKKPVQRAKAAVASGSAQKVTSDLRLNRTSASAYSISGTESGVSDAWNIEVTITEPTIPVRIGSIMEENFSFIDFFLPGDIALTLMTLAVN